MKKANRIRNDFFLLFIVAVCFCCSYVCCTARLNNVQNPIENKTSKAHMVSKYLPLSSVRLNSKSKSKSSTESSRVKTLSGISLNGKANISSELQNLMSKIAYNVIQLRNDIFHENLQMDNFHRRLLKDQLSSLMKEIMKEPYYQAVRKELEKTLSNLLKIETDTKTRLDIVLNHTKILEQCNAKVNQMEKELNAQVFPSLIAVQLTLNRFLIDLEQFIKEELIKASADVGELLAWKTKQFSTELKSFQVDITALMYDNVNSKSNPISYSHENINRLFSHLLTQIGTNKQAVCDRVYEKFDKATGFLPQLVESVRDDLLKVFGSLETVSSFRRVVVVAPIENVFQAKNGSFDYTISTTNFAKSTITSKKRGLVTCRSLLFDFTTFESQAVENLKRFFFGKYFQSFDVTFTCNNSEIIYGFNLQIKSDDAFVSEKTISETIVKFFEDNRLNFNLPSRLTGLIMNPNMSITIDGVGREIDGQNVYRYSLYKCLYRNLVLTNSICNFRSFEGTTVPITTPVPFVCGLTPIVPDTTFDSKIVEAKMNSFPWMVSIVKDGRHFCSGTLINQNWIVTAANCFKDLGPNDNLIFNLGKHDLSKTELSQITLEASNILIHESFCASSKFTNDIALVKLASPVSYTDQIRPICLASLSPSAKSDAIVTGWGSPEFYGESEITRLRQVAAKIKSATECFSWLANQMAFCADDALSFKKFVFSGRKDKICYSDNGMPLVSKENDVFYLNGIYSYGQQYVSSTSSDTCTGVASYMDISKYMDWINSRISLNTFATQSSSASCGNPTFSISDFVPRTIGGSEAKPNSYPWHVALFSRNRFVSSGVLINSQFVLTSASSLVNLPSDIIYVSLGKHNLLEFEGGQKRVLVAERAPHNSFTSNTFENDIALLKLAQPVVFTDKIKPICLGSSTPPIGSTAIISGWNFDEADILTMIELKQAYVSIKARDECSNLNYNKKLCAGDSIPFRRSKRQLNEINPCHGDKGGPLIVRSNGIFYLHGIVSYHLNSNMTISCSGIGSFTDISIYRGWISSKIAELNAPSLPTTVAQSQTTTVPTTTKLASTCGVPGIPSQIMNSQRIIGGVEATPNSWPWQVALAFTNYYFCSGSLINNQWVLTAGHCAFNIVRPVFAVFGKHNLVNEEPGQKRIEVSQIILHEGYSTTSLNDIALLKLSTPVEFNDKISPICLSSSSPAPLTQSLIVGWGISEFERTTTLRQAVVTIRNRSSCNWIKDALTICAGDGILFASNTTRDSCIGDSGGPLFAKVNDVYQLQGIISYGTSVQGNTCPGGGAYMDISKYRSWIESKIR